MTFDEAFSRPLCCTGFTWLRLLLAIGIFSFHSVTITTGSAASIPPALAALARLILPMFFALSGFLIAASLARSASLSQFITFRALRMAPALTVVVLASMFVLGPVFTQGSLRHYFSDSHLIAYLANIAGAARYGLPGVFRENPRAGIVNGSLWTIGVELWCYLGATAAFISGMTSRPLALLTAALIALVIATAGFGFSQPWALGLPTGELVLPFLAGMVIFAGARWLPNRADFALMLLAIAFVLMFDARLHLLAALPLAYATIWLGLRGASPLPGDYSYGLYLAGYPIQQAFLASFPGGAWWQTWLFCLPATFGCAMLLWHGIESPLLARKHRFVPQFDFARRPSRLRRGNASVVCAQPGATAARHT